MVTENTDLRTLLSNVYLTLDLLNLPIILCRSLSCF